MDKEQNTILVLLVEKEIYRLTSQPSYLSGKHLEEMKEEVKELKKIKETLINGDL